MSGRITWQNVDAPNLLAAAAQRGLAANTINTGMSTLGDIFQARDERAKAAAAAELAKTNQATDQATVAALLGVQDVGAYDKMAAGGDIFGALGLGGKQLTPDGLKLALGWRDRVESDRSTDQSYGEAVYDQGMQVYNDGRAKAADVRSDTLQAAQDEGLRLADSIARDSLSPQDAQLRIRDATTDPRVFAAANQALGQLGGTYWATNGQGIQDAPTAQSLTTIDRELTKREQDLNNRVSANPLGSLWLDSTKTYSGYDSPLIGMVDRLGAKVSDEDAEIFGRSKGEVSASFNKLAEAYPEVPQAVIARVMENTLGDDGWIFTGDKLDFDMGAIRSQLDQFNTPEGRNGLSQITTDYAAQQKTISDTRASIARLNTEMGVLESKPQSAKNDADLAKRRQQVQQLEQSLRTPEAPAPVAQIAAEARPQFGPQVPTQTGPQETPEEAMVRRNSAFMSGLGQVGSAIDRGAAIATTAPAWLLGQMGRASNQAIGTMVSPSLGAEGLAGWDSYLAGVEQTQQQGLVGSMMGAPAAAPQIAPPPAVAPTPQQQQQQQVPAPVARAAANIQSLASSAGVAPEEAAVVTQAMAVLADPSAPPQQKGPAQQMVNQFLATVRQNADKLSDDQIMLLSQPEAWLSAN